MAIPLMRHGVVRALAPDGMAEITLSDKAACAGCCADCRDCQTAGEELFLADNAIGAKPGDRVTVAGGPAHPAGSVLLRLAVPIAAFALGSATGSMLSDREGIIAGVGILCMLAGGALSAKIKRQQSQKIRFQILSIDG